MHSKRIPSSRLHMQLHAPHMHSTSTSRLHMQTPLSAYRLHTHLEGIKYFQFSIPKTYLQCRLPSSRLHMQLEWIQYFQFLLELDYIPTMQTPLSAYRLHTHLEWIKYFQFFIPKTYADYHPPDSTCSWSGFNIYSVSIRATIHRYECGQYVYFGAIPAAFYFPLLILVNQ